MTILYLYVGVIEQGDMQKVVSKGWCKESSLLYQPNSRAQEWMQ